MNIIHGNFATEIPTCGKTKYINPTSKFQIIVQSVITIAYTHKAMLITSYNTHVTLQQP